MEHSEFSEKFARLEKIERTAREEKRKLEKAWDEQQREPKARELMAKGPKIIEGPLNPDDSDYSHRSSYVPGLDNYLDGLPEGVTLRITIEVIKP